MLPLRLPVRPLASDSDTRCRPGQPCCAEKPAWGGASSHLPAMSDLTVQLVAMDGTPIVARLVRPERGERGAVIWGERRLDYSCRGLDFYCPVKVNRSSFRDPCGLRVGHLGIQHIEKQRFKNGNLKISHYSARNGEPRIYVYKLASAEVERLLAWLAVAEIEEALFERAAAFSPRIHTATRPSSLAIA